MSAEQSNLSPILSELAFGMHACNIQEIFGVIGDPITPLVEHSEKLGIKYFGFRNEQAASFASSAIYFLHQRVAVTLTVAGPGFANALSGMGNATVNGWANLLVCPLQSGTGRFQSMDQIACLKSFFKGYVVFSEPSSVNAAVELAVSGHPGAVCLFVPVGGYSGERIVRFDSGRFKSPSGLPPVTFAPKTAIIIGNQMVMRPDIQNKLKHLLEEFRLPFLPESLARGVLPEDHELCMTAARSAVLKSAECLVFLGAKMDWMWNTRNTSAISYVFGTHAEADGSVDDFFNFALCHSDPIWVDQLQSRVHQNKKTLSDRLHAPIRSSRLPSHWQAVGSIKRILQSMGLSDSLIISEGANTMDAVRIGLDDVRQSRLRLDAGRWGTMGGALGYLVAACKSGMNDETAISFAIVGDSAFGFAGMELETLVRYRCRAVVVVFNNGGIYTGRENSATRFNPHVKHDFLMEALGGVGFSTRDGGSVEGTFSRGIEAVQRGQFPVLVEICIDPLSGQASGSLSRI